MTISIGCGQITWRQFEDPLDKLFADIRDAGYDGKPWHASRDVSGVTETADWVRSSYAKYGLRPAPGYLWGDFWDKEQHEEILARIEFHAQVAAELDVTEVFIAAGGFDRVMRSGRTRRQAAAHAGPQDALTDDEFNLLADGLNAAGAATLRHGVRLCYHNHVGTVVETRAEIDRMLSLVDPQLVFLGPDTGHLDWAGIDVPEFCRMYAERIHAVHLKDIVGEVRDRGRDAGWDYATFSHNGVFTELGAGSVDFSGALKALSEAGFGGWLIIETDVTQKSTALESVTESLANLRALLK